MCVGFAFLCISYMCMQCAFEFINKQVNVMKIYVCV